MTVPAQRLTAVDLYHFLDWLKEAFAAGDQLREIEEFHDGRRRLRVVFEIDHQLERLQRVLAHVSEPHYSQAMNLVDELKRARLRANPDTAAIFVRFGAVIADWDRSRLRIVNKVHIDQEVA